MRGGNAEAIRRQISGVYRSSPFASTFFSWSLKVQGRFAACLAPTALGSVDANWNS
jgi:hypothetical protein